ncbi:hypothetical protein [Rhodovastum atsumiense]|uniref:Uncharacterized protein n=1 Tax=Rhodovastum atsumiense TaxID=504468 RepID=A0A5M6IUY7_9PROT|nr:hypothetical protein [Rhodovastum atsumiense]KAA5612041.1 hypothetical protein F1189_11320 [Rhodovastum atsumiense]
MANFGSGNIIFHRADILYALEWAAAAPGLGRWTVLLDDTEQTRLVSVVPPGTERPAFLITRSQEGVFVMPQAPGEEGLQIRRFGNLREAVLAICPLDDERAVAVNEAMEILYPRTLRSD